MKVLTKVEIDGNPKGSVVDMNEVDAKQLLSLGWVVPVHGDSDPEATEVSATTQEVKDANANLMTVENDFPRHTGGGWYELSDGTSVRGEDDAVNAENNLKETDTNG